MFPRQHRLVLKAHPDFFSSATHRRGTFVEIYETPGEDFQAAVSMGKYANASSSKRNYWKRVVRHILWEIKDKIGNKHIVVRIKRMPATVGYNQVYDDIRAGFDIK